MKLGLTLPAGERLGTTQGWDDCCRLRVGYKPILILTCLITLALAATAADYSGTYTTQHQTPAKEKSSESRSVICGQHVCPHFLRVTQTQAVIEITVSEGDNMLTSRPLDGTGGDCVNPHRVPGKCKGELKENYLILESMVTRRAQLGRLFASVLANDGSCPPTPKF